MKNCYIVDYYKQGMFPKEKKFKNEAAALVWASDIALEGYNAEVFKATYHKKGPVERELQFIHKIPAHIKHKKDLFGGVF